MKRFIFKVLLFFVLSISIDFTIGLVSKKFQNGSKGGITFKVKYIRDSMVDEILVMGSSRATHHYVAKLMEDSLNKTVYNVGMDGNGIVLNYGLLMEMLHRYNPSVIIYELTPHFDWIKGVENDRYLVHLRGGYDIVGVDSIFWDVNKKERYKMFSKAYRSNSLTPYYIFDNFFEQKDTTKGYIPLYGFYKKDENDSEKIDIIASEIVLDNVKVKYLKRFIALCKDNNINLIFAISPDINYDADYYDYGIKLAKENNIPVIDANTTRVFDKTDYFQDETHLNDIGARKYTNWVISELKNRHFLND